MTYSVYCYFFDKPSIKIKSRLSLENAQLICNDPDTSSRTTQGWQLLKKFGKGPWFYGYTEE
jgi:hypothetical protein